MRYASAIGSTVTATPCSFMNNEVGRDSEESVSDFFCSYHLTHSEEFVLRTAEEWV